MNGILRKVCKKWAPTVKVIRKSNYVINETYGFIRCSKLLNILGYKNTR